MSAEEIEKFESVRFYEDAVTLRKWEDEGKRYYQKIGGRFASKEEIERVEKE